MLTVGPAELGDGVDEAVVEVGRPAEPGLGVGRQNDTGPAAVPVQPQPAAAARRVLDGSGVGAAGVVDQAGEHLLCRDLTCAFGGSRRGRAPHVRKRERGERWKLYFCWLPPFFPASLLPFCACLHCSLQLAC